MFNMQVRFILKTILLDQVKLVQLLVQHLLGGLRHITAAHAHQHLEVEVLNHVPHGMVGAHLAAHHKYL